jgi:CheY-like chemotaxis protein
MVITRPGGCELSGSIRGLSAGWPITSLIGIPPVNVAVRTGSRPTLFGGVASSASRMGRRLADRADADDSRTARTRVLFVSPAGVDRDLYVSALRDAGFITTTAETAVAAARCLEDIALFDVVVADLLPEPEDAWDLIARACAHPSQIPVMVFTSLIRPDKLNRQRARAFGCAAFVAKPC